MAKTYQAHIEANGQGFYSVYVNEEFPFGFFGEGSTQEEAKQDFQAVFNAMREEHQARTGEVVEADFEYVYDISAILQECKTYLSLAGLSEVTGISKAMLSQYACGTRKPKAAMRERIIEGIHQIGQTCIAIS
ncbi:MAG: helix-turn-helix domain-containing protein [Paludibacteraceae bacterium]